MGGAQAQRKPNGSPTGGVSYDDGNRAVLSDAAGIEPCRPHWIIGAGPPINNELGRLKSIDEYHCLLLTPIVTVIFPSSR